MIKLQTELMLNFVFLCAVHHHSFKVSDLHPIMQ